MTPKEMLAFLERWQGKIVVNRHGVKAMVDGLLPGGRFVLCTFVEDPIADDKYPSRVGCSGTCLPSSLGTIWKET